MSINIEPAADSAELIATGPGAISICFVAIDGSVAGVTRLRASGPEGLVTRMDLPLSVHDGNKRAELIPFVVYQSNPGQRIRIAGSDHAADSLARSLMLGPTASDGWRAEWERRERDYWKRVPPLAG